MGEARKMSAGLAVSLAALLFFGQESYAAQRVTIEVKNPDGPACESWPILVGVPFPKGALQSAVQVRLLGPDGRERPSQVKSVATWAPGKNASIRWVHLDFQADVTAGGTAKYQVEFGKGVKRQAVTRPLKATETLDQIEIDTGVLRLIVNRKTFRFIDQAWYDANRNGRYEDAEQVLKPKAGTGPYLVDHKDNRYDAAKDKAPQVILEEHGPMRAVIRAEGWHRAGKTEGLVEGRAGPEAPKDALCKFIVRIVAYRGKPYVRVFHTFVFTADSNKVRLRDIGLPLRPDFGGNVRFGLDKSESRMPSTANGHLLQVDDERFELRGAAAKQSQSGGRAPGWFGIEGKGRGLFVMMRDFWQQYPKELECTRNEMIVHFWPAHGAPVTHPIEKITARNIHRLWFAHEGRELNFRCPADYAKKFTKTREFRYTDKATKANALGVSKTHEMLISFAKPEADMMHGRARPAVAHVGPKTAATLNRLFNNEPSALPTPSWVCAHGLFDRIHPYDPKRFPKVEEALEATFDLRDRLERHTHSTGIFNWGAGHTGWNFARKRWSAARIWHGAHSGMPRVPWIMYLRSGNPKYLRRAVRYTRHQVDIGYCRYTTPEFAKSRPGGRMRYPEQKLKGALCDYKGLVHWHSGCRLPDYNSQTDFLLYAWYVTGDYRAREMALEWGEAAKRLYATSVYRRKTPLGRGGASMMCALMALYQHTWDPACLELTERHYKRLIGPKSLKPDGGFKGFPAYAPWLTRYVRLTNNAQAKKILLRYADVLCSSFRGGRPPHLVTNGIYTNFLGEAYHISRDPKYLAVGRGIVQRAGRSLWRRRGHLYDGVTCLGVHTRPAGYFMQMAPEFLAAMSLRLQSGPLPQPIPHPAMTGFIHRPPKGKTQTHVLLIDNAEGGAFSVNVEGHNGYRKPRTYAAWVFSSSGKEVARGEAKARYGGFRIPLSVPAAGKGTYMLKVEGAGGGWRMAEPLDIRPARRYVRRIDRQPSGAAAHLGGLPVYIWVPKGTRKFAINWYSVHTGFPHMIRIYDKNGREVLEKTWISDEKSRRLSIPVAVPPGQDGGVWEIAPGPMEGARFGVSEPIPPVFSIYRDRFYVPEKIGSLTSAIGSHFR